MKLKDETVQILNGLLIQLNELLPLAIENLGNIVSFTTGIFCGISFVIAAKMRWS